MSFDISSASSFSQLSEGAFLHFTDPQGKPLYDAVNGTTAVGVTLRGRNSAEGLEASRRIGNKRLSEASRGRAQMTVESNEANTAEVLAACTVSWTFDQLDGQPFPCNPDNARRFWSDDRFRRFRVQAEEFIDGEANFTKS